MTDLAWLDGLTLDELREQREAQRARWREAKAAADEAEELFYELDMEVQVRLDG